MLGTERLQGGRMTLNEYIYKKFMEGKCSMEPLTEHDIAYWIVDWYKDTFGNIPPQWLVNREDVVMI